MDDAPHSLHAVSSACAPVIAPAIRTWLRYLVPLTVLSAIALCPAIAIAWRLRTPADPAGAQTALAVGWAMTAAAWPAQLVLVAGASAMTAGRPSQLRALGQGLARLAGAIVPCLAAVAAIAIGSLALVVPGLVLLVILALTGASRQPGVRAALVDSIAAVRAQLPAVALAVAATLAIDAAIGAVAYAVLVGAPRGHPAQLAAVREFVRVVAASLVVASPLPATVLATIRTRAAP